MTAIAIIALYVVPILFAHAIHEIGRRPHAAPGR